MLTDYKTQILVVPEDQQKVPAVLEWLKELCEKRTAHKMPGYRDKFTHDMTWDIVLVNYNDQWMVESIRSGEKRLKWRFKEENNLPENKNA